MNPRTTAISTRATRIHTRPLIETLENRQLLSLTIDLRLPGGGKTANVGTVGQVVNVEIWATVKGNKRQLESIRSLFGEQLEEKRNSISIQRWEIAPTVFRFTLSEPLPPGEYALAEILPDGMNLFVWDFGVDPATGAKPTTALKNKN